MKKLLFFVDEGGFEDFSPMFKQLGFEVDFENNPRKAVKTAKKNHYDILVAEFSYNPEFRDRVSNLESLLATLQNNSPEAKIIVLFDAINHAQFKQFSQRYRIDNYLTFPVDGKELTALLT